VRQQKGQWVKKRMRPVAQNPSEAGKLVAQHRN